MRRNIYYIVIFLCSISYYSLYGQSIKDEIFETPEKTGGVYYAYPSGDIIIQTTAPKGYKPFYISHFGRHGSRYLINDSDYKNILNLFEDAFTNNTLTPLGIDVYNRLKEIWLEADGHGGDLSPLGLRQLRDIAERMYRSYPNVFDDNALMTARSTTVVRCVLSMDAFCERLKEFNPNLKINRDSSPKYMRYLNYHTQDAIKYRSSKDTWREEYRKFEEAHVNPDRLIGSLFSDKTYIKKKVNPVTTMWELFSIASDLQNMETEISFYDIFEKEELFDLWQCGNYNLYVNYANYTPNGGIMFDNAKPLLRNILDNANEVIASKGKGASFRFGHDGNIIPLAMLLHLDGCYESTSEPSDIYKVWNNFKVAPMAGNIQMIFFKNDKSDEIIVKFLYNEKEIIVPPVKSDILPYYNWKDLEIYYRSLLNN